MDRSFGNVKYKLPSAESPREKLNIHTWAWDVESIGDTSGSTTAPSATKTSTTRLSKNNRQVSFHPGYSSGTAAVRGNTPFIAGREYFWEIKMLTAMYGTDVMVGVGTAKVDLSKDKYKFTSLLGQDKESWGFSYNGALHHNGKWLGDYYGRGFNKDDIVGVHLDMLNGSISFYVNGLPLGVAYKSLNGHVLYPMVCSTAAFSCMELIYSYSSSSFLQNLCLQSMSTDHDMLTAVSTVPGLRDMPVKVLLDFQYVCLKARVEKDLLAAVSDDESVETTPKHRLRTRKRKFSIDIPLLTTAVEMRRLAEMNIEINDIASNTGSLNIQHFPADDLGVGLGCNNCGARCRTLVGKITRTPQYHVSTRQRNRLCNNCTFIP